MVMVRHEAIRQNRKRTIDMDMQQHAPELKHVLFHFKDRLTVIAAHDDMVIEMGIELPFSCHLLHRINEPWNREAWTFQFNASSTAVSDTVSLPRASEIVRESRRIFKENQVLSFSSELTVSIRVSCVGLKRTISSNSLIDTMAFV